MAEKRGRGRPPAYDADEALDKAAILFWENGFEATSLDSLGAAMEMGRPSIKNAFGGKEELFLKALERYRQTIGSGPLEAFDAADSIEEAIPTFLDALVGYTTADADHLGCLLSGIAGACDRPSVHDFVNGSFAYLEGELSDRLRAAVEARGLPEDYPVELAVRRLCDTMIALAVRARIGVERERLEEDAGVAAAMILALR
jgi:AcrR family transcriptional regulator